MSTAKRLVLSLRGRKQSSPGPFSGGSGGGVLPCDPGSSSSSTRLVIGSGGSRYGGAACSSPGGADHHHSSFCSNHELDEIAVVSTNADPLHVKYGSGSLTAANGPRLVPGMTTSFIWCIVLEFGISPSVCSVDTRLFVICNLVCTNYKIYRMFQNCFYILLGFVKGT